MIDNLLDGVLCTMFLDDIDIDLDDPETDKAARKIQAGFKNLKAKKKRETGAFYDDVIVAIYSPRFLIILTCLKTTKTPS